MMSREIEMRRVGAVMVWSSSSLSNSRSSSSESDKRVPDLRWHLLDDEGGRRRGEEEALPNSLSSLSQFFVFLLQEKALASAVCAFP